jgi:hypothetical protein
MVGCPRTIRSVMPCTCWTSRGMGTLGLMSVWKVASSRPSKAHCADFDQAVHNWEQPRGLSVEGQKGDISEPWLGVIHILSRPFPGEALIWKAAVAVDRLGATVQ